MPRIEAKPGLRHVISNEAYQREQEVSVDGVWNIVETVGKGAGERDEQRVLIANLYGTEEQVTRLMQETFGFNTEAVAFNTCRIVPAKTKMLCTDVAQVLHDLNIPSNRILFDYEEKEKKNKNK